jgi:uncharacterized membrane protein YraQ (UPF0718 family)
MGSAIMSSLTIVLGRNGRSLDPALGGIAAILATVAVADPGQFVGSISFTAASLGDIAPFLLLSIALAAYAKASGAENLIAKAFQGRMAGMVAIASLLGALSPFCSCGVIPLIAALLSMHVPLAPVMAFWLASPLMDPSMFVLTAATLGTGFAVAKAVAAIGVGLLGGFATMLLAKTDSAAPPLRDGIALPQRTLAAQPVVWRYWREESRRAAFAGSARRNVVFLGKWMSLAFLLESLMLAYMPAELVVQALGGHGLVPILIATLVGIPAYLNGYAALPLVAGLIEQGMAPGAGMAFLIAGGATSIPAAVAVFALVRPPIFAAYVGLAALGSILAGVLFGLVA